MSEYSEDEQWERAKAWLRSNGVWIAGGLVLGVALLNGWWWYQKRLETQAETASARYEEMVDAFSRNDITRGLTLADELNRDFKSTPYAALSSLIAARAHVEANELDKAAASLNSVMDDATDEDIQMIARLRLARVQSAQGKHDDALATLTLPEAGDFAPRIADVRGDVLLAKGDRDGALKEYLAARDGADDGLVDADLLDLKIRDLGGSPPARAEES